MDYIDSLRTHYSETHHQGHSGDTECNHRFPHISSSRCPGKDPQPRSDSLIHADGTICWYNTLGKERYDELCKDSMIIIGDEAPYHP